MTFFHKKKKGMPLIQTTENREFHKPTPVKNSDMLCLNGCDGNGIDYIFDSTPAA